MRKLFYMGTLLFQLVYWRQDAATVKPLIPRGMSQQMAKRRWTFGPSGVWCKTRSN